ncbi:hypothetical protein ASD77_11165 [Pseudoxanthomonas sp. Root65]|uniref:DUF72 domain-containing protein n=1 Tax=Pseudoxanthomonas sp. Root65 TaxID=1736576 RepID=UPI0006FBB110|nr:DUF72 domain-containing protein [Pseudoxanthomonas sp. Root65]KRA52242.1 hypothetical protein ASD77_11165 [Pseudoxanthomonas sp. Root65]
MDDLFAAAPPTATAGIRVGIGGWTYAPWRTNFYPAGLVQRRELEFASRQLTAIEINGTYYGAQKPATYASWRDQTPDGFVFSAKAPKRIMQSRSLASTQAQVEDFVGGIAELGARLGPLVWQFEAGRRVDAEELDAFLSLLPREIDGRPLRHALEVRDPAAVDAGLVDLARRHQVATVFTDSTEYPSFADLTADFVYARLMRSQPIDTGYPPKDLALWAERARAWSRGEDIAALPHVGEPAPALPRRDVFVYFISSAKERNPAAAMELIRRLGG